MASYGFVVLLFLVGIVVALVALSCRTGRSGPTATPTAKELLAQRYARGEVDDDGYFRRLSVLDSNHEPARPTDALRYQYAWRVFPGLRDFLHGWTATFLASACICPV